MKRTKIASSVFVTQVRPGKQHIVESTRGFLVRIVIDVDVVRFTSIVNSKNHSIPNYLVVPRGSYKAMRAAYNLHMRLADMHRVDWRFY